MNTDEVAATAGVTYRQLDHWVRSGILLQSLDGLDATRPHIFQEVAS